MSGRGKAKPYGRAPQGHKKGLVSSPSLNLSSSGHKNVVKAVDVVIRYAMHPASLTQQFDGKKKIVMIHLVALK